jgi:hypothetical protein
MVAVSMGLTDIKTSHVLEAPPIIAAFKHPRHVVREGSVGAKTVGREHAVDWSLATVHHRWWCGFDILHILETGNRAEVAGGGRSGADVWGDLAMPARGVAESDVELLLGVETRRVVAVLSGVSPGVWYAGRCSLRVALIQMRRGRGGTAIVWQGQGQGSRCIDRVERGYRRCKRAVADRKGYAAQRGR